jgi:hypothetical protein
MSPHRPKEKVLLPVALPGLSTGPGLVDAQAAKPKAIARVKGSIKGRVSEVFEFMQSPAKDGYVQNLCATIF